MASRVAAPQAHVPTLAAAGLSTRQAITPASAAHAHLFGSPAVVAQGPLQLALSLLAQLLAAAPLTALLQDASIGFLFAAAVRRSQFRGVLRVTRLRGQRRGSQATAAPRALRARAYIVRRTQGALVYAPDTLTPFSFSPKDPAEVLTLGFDFGALLASGVTLSAPVVTISVRGGVDASPGAVLSGGASLNGSTVLQRVAGGVAGVTYLLRAQADASDGSRYVLVGLLPVRVV